MALESLSLEKVNSIIGMLASEQDGEVVAAARMLCRLAKKSNLKINEFLKPATTPPAPDKVSWSPHTSQHANDWAFRASPFTSKAFDDLAEEIIRQSRERAQAQVRATRPPTHKQAVLEIVRRINAKTAGTTILTATDQALLYACTAAGNISAAQAQQLHELARRVGA